MPNTSIGSPRTVPVPCASKYPIQSGEIPANFHAWQSMLACDIGCGAVIPFE